MLKQQSYDEQKKPKISQRQKKQEKTSVNRISGLGIRVISNEIEDDRNRMIPINKQQYKSPIIKANYLPQLTSKGQSNRGIQVVSSRQGSNQKPLATSRSRSGKKGQSRQIKSQTNVSEFEEMYNKQPSIEKSFQSKGDEQKIYQSYQQRFREAMLKQSAFYDAQIEQLREVIALNQEKISNLINTLNIMAENGQKKQRAIAKLESRVNSNRKYAQQCYQYTLSRCKDSEVILRHLKEEIQRNSNCNIQIQNNIEYIERIIVDIFTVQRSFVNHQQVIHDEQLSQLHHNLRQVQQKVQKWSTCKKNHSLQSLRNHNLNDHLLDLRKKVESLHGKPALQHSRVDRTWDFSWINRQDLSVKIESLQFKISQLEEAKNCLADQFKDKEEKSQHAIWELSSLLNKQERQLETLNQLQIYNKQIENKLFQSRGREKTTKLQMQSQIKEMQRSKNEENMRLFKQNQVFRERYEELFRHSQYLEGLNCKHNLEIINNGNVIQQLIRQLRSQQSEIQICLRKQNEKVKSELELQKKKTAFLERQCEEARDEIKRKQEVIQSILKECLDLKVKQKNAQQLSQNMEELLSKKEKMESQRNGIYNQLIATRKELEQQELYSQHLQKQNQKLENKLLQYTTNFESQSLMFKSTIEKLKMEKMELLKTVQNSKTDRSSSSTANISQRSQKQNITITKSQQEKLLKLKKAIQMSGYKCPVPCEIDGTGYLKHSEKGTYLVDDEENLFELSIEEKHLAIKSNLIQLFQ